MIHNHEVPSSILGRATKKALAEQVPFLYKESIIWSSLLLCHLLQYGNRIGYTSSPKGIPYTVNAVFDFPCYHCPDELFSSCLNVKVNKINFMT